MKFLKPKIVIPAVFTLVLTAATSIAVIATPGDSNDPIVTLSYINDTVIPQIKEYIDSKLTSSPQAPSGGSSSYNLVNVKAGQKIIGSEGTEFVLRMGSGTIVATENGGVADLTDGIDLQNGSAVPPNHHLLSPKNDSRGIHMSTDGIILIKGTYTVIPE